MNENPRISLEMNMIDTVLAITGGNPGALRICVDVLDRTSEIDPKNTLRGFGLLILLDTYGIYESDIWLLYKDVCGESLSKMIACLRAVHLGGLGGCTEAALKHAIQHRGEGLDLDAVCKAVVDKLIDFHL